MSAVPGSAAYYQQQMQASKQRQDQQAAQNQANLQVNYTAYQEAKNRAEQKALQTGQPQTLTTSDIQAQRQQILDTKYLVQTMPGQASNGGVPTPEQKIYSIPLTGVDQEAQARGYANYQQVNKQAQQQSLAQDRAALLAQNYELFKQNQVFSNPGQPTAYGRANVHYTVGLEDRLSGPNTHYFVNLYEGGRPEKLGPANPFESPRTQEARIATSATNPNFFESLTAGYQNYFGNLYETAATNGGLARKANYAPEIEGALIGAVFQATKDQPTGINTLAQIGKEIAENPGYAIGSVAASVGFTVGTIGIGKGITLARGAIGGLRAFRAASEIGDLAEVAANQVGVKDVTTQAIKVSSKTGLEIPLQKGPFGIYTESVSKAGLRASKPTVPDYFRIESRTVGSVAGEENVITSLEDVGYSSTKTGKTSVFSGILDEKAAGKFLEPEAGKPAAETYTEIAQNEANVLKNVGTYTRIRGNVGETTPIVQTTEPTEIGGKGIFDIPTFNRGSAKVAETPGIGGVVDYSNKVLANFVKPKGAAAAKSIGKVGENPFSGGAGVTSTGKTGSSSVLGTLSKTDKDLLKATALKDIGVFSGQAASKGVNSAIPAVAANAAKAIGGFSGYANRQKGSNASGASLGFGGATGAERKARIKTIEELTNQFIPTPASNSKSSTNSVSKLLGDLSTGRGSKAQNVSITSELTKGLEDIIPKTGTSLNSLFSQETSQRSRSNTITDTAAIAGISSSLLPGLSTSQKSIFRLDIPTKNIPTPNEPTFFNFSLPGFGESKKSKKRKKRDLGYGENQFSRVDILKNAVSVQLGKEFDEIFGKVE